MVISGRTDLASESLQLSLDQAAGARALPGIRMQQSREENCRICRVEITDPEGSRRLGKPEGQYVTLQFSTPDPDTFSHASRLLSRLLRSFLPAGLPDCVCVAALGNPDITPDALGPLAASQILVTRHLKQSGDPLFHSFSSIALCRAGVLGLSGLESARQIFAFCREVNAGLVIAVDALAGTDPEGLCRSIQICDTGISPGSGVGNDRQALSSSTLGIPVIAIGVPTVLDAASLSPDSGLRSLFVTPRTIDSDVRFAARVIAYGINLALQPHLDLEQIASLLG